MPSVGMRRRTRVFGARVLRSGRRLFTTHDEEEEVKHMRRAPPPSPNHGEDWIELLDHGGGGDAECKENGWHNSNQENGHGHGHGNEDDVMDIDNEQEDQIKPNLGESQKIGLVSNDGNGRKSKSWGLVYTRKRKRTMKLKDLGFEECSTSDKRYGKKFYRKQIRKKIKSFMGTDGCDSKSGLGGKGVSCRGLVAFIESSCSHGSRSRYLFFCFLGLVLRYMRRAKVFSWRQLSSFLLSEPVRSVYSSVGIQFLPDSPFIMSSGFCKIYSSWNSTPLFAVGFSSVPYCFMYIHSSMLLKSAFLSYALAIRPVGTESEFIYDDITDDEVEHLPSVGSEELTSVIAEELSTVLTTEKEQPLSGPVVAVKAKPGRKKVARVSVSKLTGRNLPPRIGVTTRSSIQKRRTSLRSRKHKNSSGFGMRKANGALISDMFSNQDGVPFFPIKSNHEISKSIRRANVKELKSTVVGLTQDIDSARCNANILVIEPDRCYREEGAVITMEMSAPQQWFLVVKRNGLERFRLAVQNVMRPCCCNRITHAIIWAGGDDSWKLEFPNRQDWFVFKELYRKCSERSVPAPAASIIPVPRVSEVSGYAEEEHLPFRLPDSYISSRGDELSRVLEKSNPIYDMDSEDEDWLSKFNDEHCIESEPHKRVSEDLFEKIIDAFERGIYCNPDDYSDASSAVDRCQSLASKQVLEAVYSYWMAKRKKKRSALVKIFQCYQPKRGDQLSFKAVLRKKRSFKRQASQAGRGKQINFLKAIVNERHAVEEAQNATIKVQETKAAAKRSEEAAIVKRQRAQLLMETADLATYKATMALKIAEARAAAESVNITDANVPFFLSD